MMAKHDCDICRGSGFVRLPIYRHAAIFEANIVSDVEESSRQYACPECGDTVSEERIHVAREVCEAPATITEPRFQDHLRGGLAAQLGDRMLRAGLIRFEKSPEDYRGYFAMRATVGIVSPKDVASLEQRAAEAAVPLLNEAKAEAIAQIQNWGSHYGHDAIAKRDAYQMVSDGFKIASNKRALWKAA